MGMSDEKFEKMLLVWCVKVANNLKSYILICDLLCFPLLILYVKIKYEIRNIEIFAIVARVDCYFKRIIFKQ